MGSGGEIAASDERAEVEDSGAVNQIAVAAVAMSGEVDCDKMSYSASCTAGTQRREWSTRSTAER